MARKKDNAPSWFKALGVWESFLKYQRPEVVGEAFLCTLRYFNCPDESPNVSEEAKPLFLAMAESAEESWADYQARVEDGIRGQQIKKEKARQRQGKRQG